MRSLPLLLAALICAGTAAAQTTPAVAEGPGIWRLISLNGESPQNPITLAFTDDGRIAGQAPCNTYFAAAKVDESRITVSDIGATRRACPGLDEEGRYLHALSRVVLIERQGVRLTLSGHGVHLEFATPLN
jgi:heat shock protein HslJ